VGLSTDRKGAIAELAIARAALDLDIDVYAIAQGGRYDLIFDLVDRFVRVQCKWARRYGDIVVVRCCSTRRSRSGLVRRPYEPGEVDAFAAYCPDLDRCYYLPFDVFRPRSQIQLRLEPSKNNQRIGVNWARDFEFGATLARVPGAVAQLGERLAGSQKATGSSPVGSIVESARTGGRSTLLAGRFPSS
jgi:PD-(D/E)XK endonuclease